MQPTCRVRQLSEHIFLLENDYNHATDYEDTGEDDTNNSTCAQAFFDSKAVLCGVTALIGYGYLVLAGFGDLVAEIVLDFLAVHGYLDICGFGRIADGDRILGRTAFFYTVKGDSRSSSVYSYLEKISVAAYDNANLIYAVLLEFERTIVESTILTVNGHATEAFDLVKVVSEFFYKRLDNLEGDLAVVTESVGYSQGILSRLGDSCTEGVIDFLAVLEKGYSYGFVSGCDNGVGKTFIVDIDCVINRLIDGEFDLNAVACTVGYDDSVKTVSGYRIARSVRTKGLAVLEEFCGEVFLRVEYLYILVYGFLMIRTFGGDYRSCRINGEGIHLSA